MFFPPLLYLPIFHAPCQLLNDAVPFSCPGSTALQPNSMMFYDLQMQFPQNLTAADLYRLCKIRIPETNEICHRFSLHFAYVTLQFGKVRIRQTVFPIPLYMPTNPYFTAFFSFKLILGTHMNLRIFTYFYI